MLFTHRNPAFKNKNQLVMILTKREKRMKTVTNSFI